MAERGRIVDRGRIERAGAAMPFLRFYPAFATGYLLSCFYRNVNAVIWFASGWRRHGAHAAAAA